MILKSIITVIDILIFIGIADEVTRSNGEERISLWMFLITYLLTIGLIWW